MAHRVVPGPIKVGDNRNTISAISSVALQVPSHTESAVEACRAEIAVNVFLLQAGETKYTVKIVSISITVMAIHKNI